MLCGRKVFLNQAVTGVLDGALHRHFIGRFLPTFKKITDLNSPYFRST
jgi:hypothetical protein